MRLLSSKNLLRSTTAAFAICGMFALSAPASFASLLGGIEDSVNTGTGAGTGAAIGGVAGGGKGAEIGALAGAGAGLAFSTTRSMQKQHAADQKAAEDQLQAAIADSQAKVSAAEEKLQKAVAKLKAGKKSQKEIQKQADALQVGIDQLTQNIKDLQMAKKTPAHSKQLKDLQNQKAGALAAQKAALAGL